MCEDKQQSLPPQGYLVTPADPVYALHDATRADIGQQMTDTLAHIAQAFDAYRYTVRLLEERAALAEARVLELQMANDELRAQVRFLQPFAYKEFQHA